MSYQRFAYTFILAWCMFTTFRLSRAQINPAVIPFAEQLANTVWTRIDCDPGTNSFIAEFFNGIQFSNILPNNVGSSFDYTANCEGGLSLLPQPTSQIVAPSTSSSVTFFGQATDDPDSSFSLVGLQCLFTLGVKVPDPFTNSINFVTTDSVTTTCGDLQLTCQCSFFNVFCYLDSCNPNTSAFFWLLIYLISWLFIVFFVYVPIEYVRLSNQNEVLGQYTQRDSSVKATEGRSSRQRISEMVDNLNSGKENSGSLVEGWHKQDGILQDPTNNKVLRDSQLEMFQRARLQQELAKRPTSRFGWFGGKSSKGEYQQFQDLDVGGNAGVEMQQTGQSGGYAQAGQQYAVPYSREAYLPANGGGHTAPTRRPRKAGGRDESAQLAAALIGDTD